MDITDYDESKSADSSDLAAITGRIDQILKHTTFSDSDAKELVQLLDESTDSVSKQWVFSTLAKLSKTYHINLNWLLTGEI